MASGSGSSCIGNHGGSSSSISDCGSGGVGGVVVVVENGSVHTRDRFCI